MAESFDLQQGQGQTMLKVGLTSLFIMHPLPVLSPAKDNYPQVLSKKYHLLPVHELCECLCDCNQGDCADNLMDVVDGRLIEYYRGSFFQICFFFLRIKKNRKQEQTDQKNRVVLKFLWLFVEGFRPLRSSEDGPRCYS